MAAEGSILDHVPPQNVEAEASLLGSILLSGDVLGDVVQKIRPEDFYKTSHRELYEILRDLYDNHQAIDLVIVKNELERRSQLAKLGGVEALVQLAETVPSAANADHYAEIVREKAAVRSLIAVTTQILREAYESGYTSKDLLDRAEQLIFSCSRSDGAGETMHIGDLLKATFERIDKLQDNRGRLTGLPTGFIDLDDMTSGLQPGELVVVAGRPSMGKTSFVLNIADHAAVDEGRGVLIFSLETSKLQVAQNVLCGRARIDAHKMRKGEIGEDDWSNLTLAAGKLDEAKIFIDDTASLTPVGLKAKARRCKAKHDIGLVIVDYLQLMDAPMGENRQQEISVISRSLKALARELEVPVIALSQLNRAVDSRDDHRPRLSDLRESGAIEQDADLILALYREEYYDPKETNKGLAEVLVLKQRNGPVGRVQLTFLASYLRFGNLAYQSAGVS
ncbi:MAG: replicative DNA helicase [Planctomycetes bacterium]|nr:replicative DNA helicase [Planctomycetota bacterium]MBI3844339.1 replicative DNA helicase [Planctomycetota bacterium]